MNEKTKKRLHDALAACRALREFVEGRTLAEYEQHLMLRSAVERQLEIIGEALGQARRTDETLETRLHKLPRIVALRNRVIHGYDTVDDEIIWDIVQTNVPELTEQLKALLENV
jgi:uncharacterized protein with HEPN domain